MPSRRSPLGLLPVRWLVPAAMLFAASSAMCARSPDAGHGSGVATATYSTNGVVKTIDASDKSILIKHEDIPGYMKAMTMLFELRDVEQVKGLAAGDAITFTFTDEGSGKLVIQAIRKNP